MNAKLQRQVTQQTVDLRQANEILQTNKERFHMLPERIMEKERLAVFNTTVAKLAYEKEEPALHS